MEMNLRILCEIIFPNNTLFDYYYSYNINLKYPAKIIKYTGII